ELMRLLHLALPTEQAADAAGDGAQKLFAFKLVGPLVGSLMGPLVDFARLVKASLAKLLLPQETAGNVSDRAEDVPKFFFAFQLVGLMDFGCSLELRLEARFILAQLGRHVVTSYAKGC